MTLKKGDVPQENNNSQVNREEEILKQLKLAQDQLKANQTEIAALKNNQQQGQSGITAEQLAQILSVVTKKQEEELDLSAGVVAEKIPVEDIDDKGVTFYAPLSGYVISGDTRQGISVKLPWGKKNIFFEHLHTRKIKTDKGEEVAPLSRYHSHSKKEIEWLRGHSFFNIIFHESSSTMKNLEEARAARLADILIGIKGLSLHEIVKRCHAEGLGVNDNIEDMRSHLAYKMFEREVSLDQDVLKTKAENVEKQKQLLNK